MTTVHGVPPLSRRWANSRVAELPPVLHLLPAEPYGGLQRIVIQLARAQRAAGLEVNLVLLGPSDRVETESRAAGIEPIMLSGSRLGRTAALRGLLAERRGAIIHTHCEPIWATIARVGLAVTWVAHLHVYAGRETLRDRLINRLYRRHVDRFIGITQSVADSFLALGIAAPERVDVVHNGADPALLPLPASRPADRFTIGFVGRAVREKGLFDFIAAADLLRDDDIDFVIAGEGEDLDEARQTIETLGLTDRIEVTGFVEDMAPVWARIDMLAMFSEREPFGLVILEAIASGVAVLGYDTPSGGREVMEELPGCTMIAPHSVSAITDAVRHAASRRGALREEVRSGREVVINRFSLERMEKGVARCYAQLAANGALDSKVSLAG